MPSAPVLLESLVEDEAPSRLPPAEDCFYYHTIDLGAAGLERGQWDLRDRASRYLGGADLAGRSVLEIGPASGFLTAEMERAGAEVTALELASGEAWDLVPYAGWDDSGFRKTRARLQERLRNSFWRTHGLLGLRSRLLLGSVHALRPSLGSFDVATVCAVLLHLRDPFGALERVAGVVRDRLVVSEGIPGECLDPTTRELLEEAHRRQDSRALEQRLDELDRGHLHDPGCFFFRPDGRLQQPKETWWALPPRAVEACLEVLGFEVERFTTTLLTHDSRYAFHRPAVDRVSYHPTYTLIARRRPG